MTGFEQFLVVTNSALVAGNLLMAFAILRTVRPIEDQPKIARDGIAAASFTLMVQTLQSQEIRAARSTLLSDRKEYAFESEEDFRQILQVFNTYDLMAALPMAGVVPASLLINCWGDSLRKCWSRGRHYVAWARIERSDPHFYERFEWAAKLAFDANPNSGPFEPATLQWPNLMPYKLGAGDGILSDDLEERRKQIARTDRHFL